MDYTTHRIGGICFGLIASTAVTKDISNIYPIMIITGSSFIGSLVPDIDEPTSFMGRKVKLLSGALKAFLGHRGFIHTPLFMILTTILIYYFTSKYIDGNLPFLMSYGYIVGFFSHLFLDTITPKGIMWLYPFSKRYYSTQSKRLIKAILIILTSLFFIYFFNLIPYIKNLLNI